MVDWAGTALTLYDKVTGNSSKVYLFVATLPFSMYCYAQACQSMKEEDWINAHISMYEFFGGATRILTPDNLKVGILSNKKYEDPVVNRSYQELADHYQTALLPARVLAPRDKAAVEGSVGNLTSYIIARLRNRKFFDLHTMNTAICKELERFNDAPFQKKDGSRHSIFLEEELPFLQPLPRYPYEFAQWKSATVQLNYHIAVDFQNYSIPYEYVRKKVDVRYTKSSIEVYYKGNRICSHKRLYGRRGQYSTVPEHMPVNHQLYSEWDKPRFLKWASGIGDATHMVIQKMFDSYRIEEHAPQAPGRSGDTAPPPLPAPAYNMDKCAVAPCRPLPVMFCSVSDMGLSFYFPCPSRHTLNVPKMIFQSTQKLRSCIYSMSRSIHSSKDRSFRCGAICQ